MFDPDIPPSRDLLGYCKDFPAFGCVLDSFIVIAIYPLTENDNTNLTVTSDNGNVTFFVDNQEDGDVVQWEGGLEVACQTPNTNRCNNNQPSVWKQDWTFNKEVELVSAVVYFNEFPTNFTATQGTKMTTVEIPLPVPLSIPGNLAFPLPCYGQSYSEFPQNRLFEMRFFVNISHMTPVANLFCITLASEVSYFPAALQSYLKVREETQLQVITITPISPKS
eukprot:g73938.t1